MKPTIHINIAPDGSLQVDAEGFIGNGCTDATAALEQALGRVTERLRKPEYYRRQRRQTRARRNLRQSRGDV